jgi:hypothetical protein
VSSQASGTGKAAVSFGGSEAGAGDTAHAMRSRAAVGLVLAAVALATASLPAVFWWWRRSGASFGLTLGVLLSIAVGAGFGLVLFAAGTLRELNGFVFPTPREVWLLPVCGLFLLAFLVAPAPRTGRRE